MDHQKPSEKSGCSLPFFPISFFCSPGTSFFDRIRLSFDRHAANQRLIKKKEINRDRSNETRQSTNDRHSKKKERKEIKEKKSLLFSFMGLSLSFPLEWWDFPFWLFVFITQSRYAPLLESDWSPVVGWGSIGFHWEWPGFWFSHLRTWEECNSKP